MNTSKSTTHTTPAEKSTYLWNTASGLLMAFQSVIMLMVLTRVTDAATAVSSLLPTPTPTSSST